MSITRRKFLQLLSGVAGVAVSGISIAVPKDGLYPWQRKSLQEARRSNTMDVEPGIGKTYGQKLMTYGFLFPNGKMIKAEFYGTPPAKMMYGAEFIYDLTLSMWVKDKTNLDPLPADRSATIRAFHDLPYTDHVELQAIGLMYKPNWPRNV